MYPYRQQYWPDLLMLICGTKGRWVDKNCGEHYKAVMIRGYLKQTGDSLINRSNFGNVIKHFIHFTNRRKYWGMFGFSVSLYHIYISFNLNMFYFDMTSHLHSLTVCVIVDRLAVVLCMYCTSFSIPCGMNLCTLPSAPIGFTAFFWGVHSMVPSAQQEFISWRRYWDIVSQ